MEVHAHSHTARKKWTHYFWEFFMLFLAVTLGFFVENKREHFIEHKRAKQYANMLKYDLMNDTLRLNEFIANKDSLTNVHTRLKKLFETPTDKITFGDYYTIKGFSLDLTVFDPQDATYSQLKSSGNLRYFGNPEIVLKLAFYELAIRRFKSSWSELKSMYGGMSSEHILQQNIISTKFFNKYPNQDPGRLIKDAGYRFESWEEAGTILSQLLECLDILNDFQYPDLKKAATEIITMLNDEYHLE